MFQFVLRLTGVYILNEAFIPFLLLSQKLVFSFRLCVSSLACLLLSVVLWYLSLTVPLPVLGVLMYLEY